MKKYRRSLNLGFDLGDRIEVYAGADQINGTGSFIAFKGKVLVWSDDSGFIRYTFLGPEISIRKV